MHLVAEFFSYQTQCVRTVSVVINDENPKSLLGRRHKLLPSRLFTALVTPKSRVIIFTPWASGRLLRDGRQNLLHLPEVGGLDQMVIKPGVLRTLSV